MLSVSSVRRIFVARAHQDMRRGIDTLASGAALGPSTTWVPPSDLLVFQLDHPPPTSQIFFHSLNHHSVKSGQHQIAYLRTV